MNDSKREVNFGQALELMKVGRRLQRSGWNGHMQRIGRFAQR